LSELAHEKKINEKASVQAVKNAMTENRVEVLDLFN